MSIEEGFEKVKKELAESRQAIMDFTLAQKDKAIQKAEAALKALDREAAAAESRLKKSWDKMMDEAKQRKADKALQELKKRRQETAAKLEKLKQSTSKSWDHAKEGFIKSYQALREAFEKATKEFKS